jgi:hypothetical protein
MKLRAYFTNFALSLSLAAGVLAVTATASAQVPTRMNVTIPFAFTADDVSLSAGTYYVETTTDHFLTLRNINTDKTSVVMIRPDVGESNSGPTRLTFHRHMGQTYLAQVWSAGTGQHSELTTHPKPRRDREAIQLAQKDSVVEIASR